MNVLLLRDVGVVVTIVRAVRDSLLIVVMCLVTDYCIMAYYCDEVQV